MNLNVKNKPLKVLGFILFFCFICACNHRNKHLVALYGKPRALGKVLQVGIVCSQEMWGSSVGDSLRFWLAKDTIFFDNHITEKRFSYLHILPEDMRHFPKYHRNLLYIFGTQDLQYLDTIQRKNAQAKEEYLFLKEEIAKGQISVYANFGTISKQEITKKLAKKWTQITKYWWENERQAMRDKVFNFEMHKISPLEQWIEKKYGILYRVPINFLPYYITKNSLIFQDKNAPKMKVFLQIMNGVSDKNKLNFYQKDSINIDSQNKYTNEISNFFYWENKKTSRKGILLQNNATTHKKYLIEVLVYLNKNSNNVLNLLQAEALLML